MARARVNAGWWGRRFLRTAIIACLLGGLVTACGGRATDTRGDSQPDAAMATAELKRQMQALTESMEPRLEWRLTVADGRGKCSVSTLDGDPLPDDGERHLTWEAHATGTTRDEAVRSLEAAFATAAYEPLPHSDPQVLRNYVNGTMLGTPYFWRVEAPEGLLRLIGRTPCLD